MTQSNFNLPNTDGATFRSNNNTAHQAHATWSSGSTAPGTTYPYQVWIDTANGLLKRRNASNTAWITEGRIDGSNPQTLETAFRSPVATLSDLQAIGTGNLTTGDVRYMAGRTNDNDGGEGVFVWNGSDLSTEVGNDEVTANEGDGGIDVAPAGDKTGASGAWVRQYVGSRWAEWYGVTLNGTTDDGPALQAAVDALEADGGGGVIEIGAGDLLVSTPVTVEGSGIELRGQGRATRIVNGTADATAITFGDAVSTYNRNRLEGFSFGQVSGTTAVNGNAAFEFKQCAGFEVEDVYVFPFPGPNYRGALFTNGCSQAQISRLQVQDTLFDGITFEGGTLDIYVDHSRADGTGNNGWVFDNVEGFYMDSCGGFGNDQHAWGIGIGGGSALCRNMWFHKCIGDTSGSYNWLIEGLHEGFFTDAWGSTNQDTGVNTFASGFLFDGGDVDTVRVTGGGALANNSHGLVVSNNADNVTIYNFTAGSDSGAGRGNGKSGSGNGINIGGAAGTVRVNGGSALGNADAGIGGTLPKGGVKNVIGFVTENFDQTGSLSTDANGELSIAHGLDVTPVAANAGILSDTTWRAHVKDLDGTNITLQIYDSAGSLVTSTAVGTVQWWASA